MISTNLGFCVILCDASLETVDSTFVDDQLTKTRNRTNCDVSKCLPEQKVDIKRLAYT